MSADGDVTDHHGATNTSDYWIAELDSLGNLVWSKSLGGSNNDEGYSLSVTNDGGFIVAGYTRSTDGDVIGKHGGDDYWVVKINVGGGIQWQKCLGGSYDDIAYSIEQTADRGYIVAGASCSADGDITNHFGPVTKNDYWVVKLDSNGTVKWQKSMGGADSERSNFIHQCSDGGYITGGYTWSNNGDIMGNHGDSDFWIVKLGPDVTAHKTLVSSPIFSLYPNPAEEYVTLRTTSPIQSIRVTDAVGRSVGAQNFVPLPENRLDISHWKPGLYTIRIQTAEGTAVQRVVKK